MHRLTVSCILLGVSLLAGSAYAQGNTPRELTESPQCSQRNIAEKTQAGSGQSQAVAGVGPLTRNIFVFSNYDGGTYTIVVDQNLPNIQIGIVSYAPSTVTLTGPFLSNVSVVRVTGFSTTSVVKGIPSTKVQFAPMEPVTLRQPYASSQMVCATGARVLSWGAGGCNSTTQVEEYFLSKFGEVPYLSHQSRYEAFSGSISLSAARRNLVVVRDIVEFDLAAAMGRPATPVSAVVDVNATIGSINPGIPALTTGSLLAGSTVRINNYGNILGAGGAGGSGGNGGGGQTRSCGRDGSPGGTAIYLTAPAAINNAGSIWGGGGGGGGGSGCNANAGGGGGAGYVGGAGGAGASSLSNAAELAFCGQDNGVRTGEAGMVGSGGGGAGGKVGGWNVGEYEMVGGNGGGFGQPGQAPSACGSLQPSRGGAAGTAIKRNGYAINIPDGSYASGCGQIRGPVVP